MQEYAYAPDSIGELVERHQEPYITPEAHGHFNIGSGLMILGIIIIIFALWPKNPKG